MRTCSVEGCDRKHLAKGMCRRHYSRMYLHGRLDVVVFRGPVPERLAGQSASLPNGCVVFTGYLTPKGYGHIGIDGSKRFAHVLAYEQAYGPVPAGLEVDHLCRNRACINPEHLEAVPHQVNCQRGVAGKNWHRRFRDLSGRWAPGFMK